MRTLAAILVIAGAKIGAGITNVELGSTWVLLIIGFAVCVYGDIKDADNFL